MTAGVTLTGARQVAQEPATKTVPDLPAGSVGALSLAYPTDCKQVREPKPGIDCSEAEWQVVTRVGKTYRVPQALTHTVKDRRVPVALSRDGRMFAYYSRQAQTYVVRDMEAGTEVTSPVKVGEERIDIGSMLVVSDDGRYLAFDPREGSKQPGLLIDVRTGKTVSLNGEYEAIGIKDGLVEMVRYRKTDLWLMPVKGGGKPVRFDGTYIMFSELAPDRRTVAAVEFDELRRNKLTLLDAKTGRMLRKVPVRGVPAKAGLVGVRIWSSASEVVLDYQVGVRLRSYGLNVGTGRLRHLADYPDVGFKQAALPGSW
ncbi:hypothetical protein ITP53_22895 [Nonomuraea sp. K274]|uniref:Uncharacterized protein n=2 Tax=Nonomuraea cypriaca TaxID=1187855 RepID=A0A931ABH6_9ACTN|nr:hypothetical protein [Nonomuraea cypriaca]